KQKSKEGQPVDSKDSEEKSSGGKEKGKGSSKGQKHKASDKDEEKKNGEDTRPAQEEEERSPDRQTSDPSPPGSTLWQGLLDFLAKLLKWIVIGAVILLVAFFGVRALLQFLANFTSWARNLLAAWNKLLAWWQ